jgi:transcriptional regulator NrdR family protein
MDCPKCKSADTEVLQTYRRWRAGVTRRTHECKACGHRFTSYQLLGENLRQFLKSQKSPTGSK